MSPLMGRPSLRGTALLGRELALLLAILISSAPLSMLLDGSSWLTLTLAATAPVIVSGAVLRSLLRHLWLVPLAQLVVLAVMLLVMESVQGLVSVSDGPIALVTAQTSIFPGAMSELASGTAPMTLGSRGTVAVVLLMALGTLILDLVYVDLGWHTPTGLALLGTLLIPALQAPEGGSWWTVAGPVLAGLLILATRTLHADPSYIEGDRRPQAGPLPMPLRTTGAAVVGTLLIASLAMPLGAALPQIAPTQVALDMDVINQWQNRDMPQLGPVMIDDDISVRRSLLEQSDAEVLRYSTTAAEPSYLRLRTLNSFDGENFTADVSGEEPLLGRTAFSDARTDGTAVAGTSADLETTEISVEDLAGDRLPAPSDIRRVTTSDAEVSDALSVQPTNGEIAMSGVRTSLVGLGYTVTTETSPASPEALRTVDPAVFDQPLEAGYIRTEEVPQIAVDLADQVRADAGAENAFDTAVAYQEYFNSSFAYSLTVNSPPGEDPLESFLADRIGYCEQFAASFALMMTSQGYPTRVAIGFTPGEQDGDQWSVTAKNAHAWPEVWFGPEYGWVRFEPTPSAAANGVSTPSVTEDGSGQDDSDAAEEPSEAPTTEGPEEASASEEAVTTEDPARSADASTSDGGGLVTDPATVQRVEGGVFTLLILGFLVAAGGAAAVVLVRRHRVNSRDARWDQYVQGATGDDAEGERGSGDGAGDGPLDPADAAILAERIRRRAGELAWTELTWELVVRDRVLRLIGWTGAWGSPPQRIALDDSLPPGRALEDLLAQIAAGDTEVTDEDHAAAARIASACTAARYAAPLPEPGAAAAAQATASATPPSAGSARDAAAPSAPGPSTPASADGASEPATDTMASLRADSDQLIALIRRAR
ncbi:MAG: DUF3488 and transglutaminase-like domain-containing protein [Brachybacterium alimentarium]